MNKNYIVLEIPKQIFDNFSTVVLSNKLEHLDIDVCKYSYGDGVESILHFIKLSNKTQLRIYEFNELVNILNMYLEKIEYDISTNNLYPFL